MDSSTGGAECGGDAGSAKVGRVAGPAQFPPDHQCSSSSGQAGSESDSDSGAKSLVNADADPRAVL